MIYKIYPSIGIARVGNSPDGFFIGPESPESLGLETLMDGSERPVQDFKDTSFRVKRQAARFRIFEFDNPTHAGRPAQFPPGSKIRWHVKLANRKDAVIRNGEPTAEDQLAGRPAPLPVSDPARSNRAIIAEGDAPDPGAPPIKLSGNYLKGTARQTSVFLGELRRNRDDQLLVLGGHGTSTSPEGAAIGDEPHGGGFYNNRGWFDDVSDGPVSVEITLPGGGLINPSGAWVVVAPPDFAPGTAGVVTLYDVMFQAAFERNEISLADQPSFSRDIWPILRRAAGLRWVNSAGHWKRFNTDSRRLADSSAAAAPLRQEQADFLRQIGKGGQNGRAVLRNFSLRHWQEDYIGKWQRGAFISDFTGALPDSGVISPLVLTRTVLDGAVAQGFFPGIEAGIVVTNRTIYSEPFRIGGHMQAGDLTALMALPWQADFWDCSGDWWPSQRPDEAHQLADPNSSLPWHRPLQSSDHPHRDLVAKFGKFGMIVPRTVNGSEVQVEVGRDPNF